MDFTGRGCSLQPALVDKGWKYMASDLAHLFERLQKAKGNFRYDHQQMLVSWSFQRPTDVEIQNVRKWNVNIWKAVFNLIDTSHKRPRRRVSPLPLAARQSEL
ncbi:hypothetical protein PABG_12548 [Paracoccidioides brasiliensis Pb03]|nr:hypothetical protein PABG_12548 [Paracoccidioides brasiliensis Pb03]